MDLNNVIKKPIITEKSTESTGLGRYAFLVDRQANKKEIAQAVKRFFGVHPQKVWTVMMPGKKSAKGRLSSGRKKAIVQLAEGEKIDIFETGE